MSTKIIITHYPFSHEDFVPEPSAEEKESYIGLLFETEEFMEGKDSGREAEFPRGMHLVSISEFLSKIEELECDAKEKLLERWKPYLMLANETKNKKYTMFIPISVDCCEEMTTVN